MTVVPRYSGRWRDFLVSLGAGDGAQVSVSREGARKAPKLLAFAFPVDIVYRARARGRRVTATVYEAWLGAWGGDGKSELQMAVRPPATPPQQALALGEW